jgi:hypothetical protein
MGRRIHLFVNAVKLVKSRQHPYCFHFGYNKTNDTIFGAQFVALLTCWLYGSGALSLVDMATAPKREVGVGMGVLTLCSKMDTFGRLLSGGVDACL